MNIIKGCKVQSNCKYEKVCFDRKNQPKTCLGYPNAICEVDSCDGCNPRWIDNNEQVFCKIPVDPIPPHPN